MGEIKAEEVVMVARVVDREVTAVEEIKATPKVAAEDTPKAATSKEEEDGSDLLGHDILSDLACSVVRTF